MAERLRGCVCYCPDFKLYKYSISDLVTPENSVEYKFDETELENAIASYLKNNDMANAEIMANTTGLARVNPHMYVIVVISRESKPSLEILSPEEYEKRASGG